MNEDIVLNYIRVTAGDEPSNLLPVSGGLTNAEKYKVSVGGQNWMVKLDYSGVRKELWYRELNRRATVQMANPQKYRVFKDGTMCLMSPWINGENLASILEHATPEEACTLGRQAARILLQLHRNAAEVSSYKQRLRKRLYTVCNQVETLKLSFPGHKECCSFLRHKAEIHRPKRICLVHNDIRPDNFIVFEGQVFLIDFDNGGIGERAADFSYLTTLVMPEHMLFSRALTETYLYEADDMDFWQDNLLYSTLHVMDYAIWKWRTKGRQVYAQANNLMIQYNEFTSIIPQWWNMD